MSIARSALVALVVAVVAGAAGAQPAERAWHEPARYRLTYAADLHALAERRPQQWRVWIPLPADTPAQRVVATSIDSPVPHRLESDAFGNRMAYLEGSAAPAGRVVLHVDVERKPYTGIPLSAVIAGSPLDPVRYTQPNALIPLEGVIGRLSEQESRGHDGDGAKAEAFYDYIVRTMRYDKSGTGWGRGDAVWACDNKRGNCTDFHSLFIGLARAQHIPARFVIGLPVPATIEREGAIPGYHCWAEWFDRSRGWVPLDASEAVKSGRHEAYWGALPNDRVEFTTGRDLVLAPKQAGPPLNFFIYPYAEADGAPVDGLSASFSVERLDTTAS